MLKNPSEKYRPFPTIHLPDRQWPNRTINKAPIWMSSDLRDGNQSLFEPMTIDTKLEVFSTLCQAGFKEIEVAFPSASDTEFNLVRRLIDEQRIPDDVTIVVLTPAREALIRRTFESINGASRAIVHVYNATCKSFLEKVFMMSREQVIDMAVNAVHLIKELAKTIPQTEIILQYSPEHFSSTDLDFSLAICNAVTAVWDPAPNQKIIFNFPATVEVATPNVYADQIEWMDRHLDRRDRVLISLHTHNDRGTAVAAIELGLMAGADRVEGCLFGNGERTGNVDLIVLALNLYTQGVAPGLDFSDINRVARTMEACTNLPIHPRHPYVGDLVFTAFSGSHQDAIKKGISLLKKGDFWDIPYLPIDPSDLGRSYDSIIRINSQSGKGGIAYILENQHGIIMPRRMQVEFSAIVQNYTNTHGKEITGDDIWRLFSQTYLELHTPYKLLSHTLFNDGKKQTAKLTLTVHGIEQTITGSGNGPIDAAVNALAEIGLSLSVRSYEERGMSESKTGGDAKACAIIEIATHDKELFGVGIDENIVTASLLAIMSAINRNAS
jgi:2-isopropylmalate synthase